MRTRYLTLRQPQLTDFFDVVSQPVISQDVEICGVYITPEVLCANSVEG